MLTIKDVKDYLKRIEKIDYLLENKKEEYAFYKDKAVGTTSQLSADKVQSSGNQQKMADAIGEYLEIKEEINLLEAERKDIIHTIEQLPAKEYKVLYRRYVKRMTFKAIGADCGQSESWASTVYGRALKSLQRILNAKEDEKCDKLEVL